VSFDALSWAAKQRPGNLAAKMVLLALANWADDGGCAYPSTAAIAEFGDMDHKTATAALDRLIALELVTDTGEREGRTRQIKVYQLNLSSLPKTEAYQKRKPPVSSVKAPQKRGTDTVRDTGSEAKASSHTGKHFLPDDWELPAITDLPPQARACAEQWTAASYATHGEAFIGYWRTTRRKMADWRLTWANRIVALHGQVMRDQKFGNAPTGGKPASPSGKQWTPEEQAAYLARIAANSSDEAPPRPPDAKRECTAFGTPIGQIAQRIAGQA